MRRCLMFFCLSLAVAPAFAAGSLADVQVHDRASGRVLPVYESGGRWFIAGKPGNEYQVTVRNRAGGDLLAVVSVDGINVVTGETAAAERLRDRSRQRDVDQGLAQEPGKSGCVLFH